MNQTKDKTILCMDMDAFFVSLEQASNPFLRNKPVAVIGAKERTVITTSSYEARKMGVKTGMSKYEGQRVCPELILVTGSNQKYTYISRQITAYLRNITPMVESYSIDEAFMDISDLNLAADEVAYFIKTFVQQQFSITCSIGVGNNKLIAKMASEEKKPDGYYQVPPKDNLKFIDTLKLGDIWGIGRKLTRRFANMGVFSPADVRGVGKDQLEKILGKRGPVIYDMVCGQYHSPIVTESPPVKSVGHSMTLPEDMVDHNICENYLLQLAEMVSRRARNHKVSGRTITLYVRYGDLNQFTRSHTLSYFTSATHHIYRTALHLFNKHSNVEYGIRLLGISISGLIHGAVNFNTIEDADQNWEQIYNAIDTVNQKYGDAALSFASVLNCKRKGAMTISPAWRPDGIRYVDVK